jgi:cathepsin A (carboxypeptidase C)
MYHFLQAFFTQHPEYASKEFFVFGESYGGHYAPAIASRIYQGNNRKEGLNINLKGVGVGNGLTDPVIQYQYYPTMAMNNSYGIKTVTEEQYDKMNQHMPACIKLAKACQFNVSACEDAYTYCNLMETTPYYNSGLNPYDIRVPCGESDLCYDFSNIETWLNLPATRAALHVSDKSAEWQSCNTVVDVMFMKDWMRNYQQVLVPMMEDNIRVMIYAGDVDFICNWIGNKAWTLNLPWSGKSKFNAAPDSNWLFSKNGADKIKGGLVRTAKASKGEGSLTFLQVFEAGHMVPMDQPEAALTLLNDFLTSKF